MLVTLILTISAIYEAFEVIYVVGFSLMTRDSEFIMFIFERQKLKREKNM